MELPARYKVLTKGHQKGGFGSITPLEDTFLRRVVLLKTIQKSEQSNQILNELLGLCGARSRHVVEIYDVIRNEKSEIQGVIIERLRGRDFHDFHKQAKQDQYTFLKIIYQLACALKDLHSAGITHRDLKLDNFKESAAGIVKIFDFGISSFEDDYKTSQNKGTFVYAAPELYIPNASIKPEIDIYALGICAWALAHHEFPVQLLETPPQTSGPAPSISNVILDSNEINNIIHPEVISIIDRCIDPAPEKRPSAEELSTLLAQHLNRNKHRGIFIQSKLRIVELSKNQPWVTLKVGTLGEIKIAYDGIIFRVAEVKGTVSINNIPALPGHTLHEACVIGFGAANLGRNREWVTFFSSHPEVVL